MSLDPEFEPGTRKELGSLVFTADAIIEFAAGLLARYKCPQKVNFVDELPQNQSGKVLKRSLR